MPSDRWLRKQQIAIAQQRHWITMHGETESGYVDRYGSRFAEHHYGDGGELIFAADMGALARLLATVAHYGQRYGGSPYIIHVSDVAKRVNEVLHRYSHPWELIVTAWLHDVVEDGKITLPHVLNTFGYHVAVAVDAITRRKGESYDHYINRVATNHVATVVKLADLESNLAASPPASLRRRYARAREILLTQAQPFPIYAKAVEEKRA